MSSHQQAIYDSIGRSYSQQRRSDPVIAERIRLALGSATSILNVGAGTGSYEPVDRPVVAVEPSAVMISQRPASVAPVIQARAEQLPLASHTFDAVMAILTVHHWQDRERGLGECARVARHRVVLLTWDADVDPFWLLKDYFPEFVSRDRQHFPRISEYAAMFGAAARMEVTPVPVPRECQDGFLGAFWARPAAYLDPKVRAGMSSFAVPGSDAGLERLRADIESGRWHRRYGHLTSMPDLDMGYRLLTVSFP